MRNRLTQVCILWIWVALPVALSADSDWIHHDLAIGLDPDRGHLTVTDRIELPENRMDRPVEFLLNGALEIVAANPPVTRVAPGDLKSFFGINSSTQLSDEIELVRYRVEGSSAEGILEISYGGAFNFGLSDQKEEYTRGFRETSGIVADEGVYLAGSGFWYPHFDEQLIEFQMEVEKPNGWQVISQGNGTASGGDGKATWTSAGPMDEIYVVGGRLVLYEEAAGAVQAQVYLREPDDGMAAKYLTATAQYIEMYRDLIGPYPYQKFALVENFWETGYGMPSFTLLGSSIIRFPFILTSSYPHEILHNWWGNSVFVDYKTGNWAEGLTAYLADHLIQEQRGQGGEYRRATLQKYRNYVRDSSDFALEEFRSRHSAATEAVGYGKTLMGFHMLRLHLGDEAFRRGLANLYRLYRGKKASFADLQKTFEETSEMSLGWFFQPWVERPGAAALEVEAQVTASGTGFSISGSLRQTQTADPFELEVPIAIQAETGAEDLIVRTTGRETYFEAETTHRPLALQVDPQFDLFRLLDARELPPSIGQIFGESEILALLPAEAAPESIAAYRSLVEAWQSDSHSIELRLDSDVDRLPADRAVWLLGRENRHAEGGLTGLESGLTIGTESISLDGEAVPMQDHSLVVVARHPANVEKAIGWLVLEPLGASAGMARKLPHYGKYSYLAFEGTEPTNVVKGQWATADSPLYLDLRPEGEQIRPGQPVQVAVREALIDLPPAFSQTRLMSHVEVLASSELEGRGPGSRGLEQAADYIVEQFRQIGLEPGGDDESFDQRFTIDHGPDGGPVELRNLIGFLPATKGEMADESVIVSAHYDHLGLGWPDAHSGDDGQVHPGADDNASGISVMIELARAISESDKPGRNLVFVAFSGEEAGRSGSKYFVEHPTPFPAAGLRAVINLDTVGRLEDKPVSILGTATADEWQHIFRGASYVTGVESKNVPGGAEGSDQLSFIELGIPGVQIFSQAHEDYHRPGDTVEEIDGAGLVKVATLVKEAIVYLADREEPLTVRIAGGDVGGPATVPNREAGSGRRVRFGTVPDFGFSGPGVRVEEVSKGSPAETAGLRAGDVLIRLDDAEITDLRGYSEILKLLEPGQKVVATLLRSGEEIRLDVTVEER